MGSMSRTTEDVSQVVLVSLDNIFSLRHTMIVPAIDSLCASPSREVNAKERALSFLKMISFSETSVDLRM